jgi:hypothetical protein
VYLRKDIFLWYQTHLAGMTMPFTWETFKTSFLEAWGETDKEQTAKDKLKHMYATKGGMLCVCH